MEKIIYENVSLSYLINTLNTGVHGIENLEMVGIFSKKRPGIVIKVMNIDISAKVVEMMQTGIGALNLEEYNNEFDVETELLDFVVFSMIEEETDSDSDSKEYENLFQVDLTSGSFKPKQFVLVNMSLIEYIVIQNTVAGNENFLQSEEWILIEFESDEMEAARSENLIEES